MPLAVYTVSLGCPKNLVDTEAMLACLGPDMRPASDPARADLVLVNTCGFIEPAVTESLDAIMELAAALARPAGPHAGPHAGPILAVTGCLVSRYGADALAREIPEVDLWLSTRELDQWPARLGAALGRTLLQNPSPSRCLSTGPGFAYLKIAEGCGHGCAFCTIPFIRGPLASRPIQALVAEARELLETGVPELVLVAQDSTAYGADRPPGPDSKDRPGLPDLLERLLPLPGLARLRLMYLYPAGLTPKLLDFVREAGPTLVPYFDVPLQHSHPDILRAMGRPFASDPRLVLDRIRERLPQAAVRTSLMTGFPGETEESFQHLACFVKQARFHHLGVFAYCDEQGAASRALPGKVDPALAQARRDELMALQADISAAIMAEYVGRTMDVVVDAPHPEWPGLFVGRTWFQAPEVDGTTFVSGPGVVPGAVVSAEIVESKTYDLVALSAEDPDA